MSQSLIIIGTYRNNRSMVVGLSNPKNNRVANSEEFAHLRKMYKLYFKPNKHKFKTVKILTNTMEGGTSTYGQRHDTLLSAYRCILNDTPDFGQSNY